MLRLVSRRLFFVTMVLAAAGALASGASTRAASPTVVVLTATGTVDSVMASYLAGGLAGAENEGASAVVIRLDTPGGSLDSMQTIVSALLESRVPTIVWVAPAGGRAASAGTFITLAANLAFMAPGTEIGAASPVDSSGQTITGTEGQKVLNDAVAKITAIAEERHRNVAWAVSTVTAAKSSSASEAVSVGAVDGIATSLDAVLLAASGRQVTVGGETITLALAGATTSSAEMNPFQSFLHLLSDPNIAFILFTIGFYGLLAEVWHPNFVTGILGGLSIILAFIGFGSLPLNVAGLLLIGLGILLFSLEATVTSHGLLAVGGLVAFALGASALYTAPVNPAEPVVVVALPLLITTTATTAAFMGLIAWAAIRSRRMASPASLVGGATGPPVGSVVMVRRPLEPRGSIHAAGEEWTARTADGRPIGRGETVRVVGMDGLTVIVQPDPSSSSQP